jgi:hypothetical protein
VSRRRAVAAQALVAQHAVELRAQAFDGAPAGVLKLSVRNSTAMQSRVSKACCSSISLHWC